MNSATAENAPGETLYRKLLAEAGEHRREEALARALARRVAEGREFLAREADGEFDDDGAPF